MYIMFTLWISEIKWSGIKFMGSIITNQMKTRLLYYCAPVLYFT